MPAVLCVGHAVQDLVCTVPSLPDRGAKYRATSFTSVGGGPAATAAVAIARLGGQAVLAARVGEDAAADMIVAELQGHGVDCSYVRRCAGCASSVSAVIVDARGALDIVRLEQGPAKFSRQFLNIPTEHQYKRFRKDDFVFYKLSPDRRFAIVGEGEDATRYSIDKMRKYMVIDPATGEGKKSDETAISIVGVEKSGFKFVLEDWAKQVLPHETIEQIFYFADKWNVQYVCPEDVSYQKVFRHFLREKMGERGFKFSIRPVKPANQSKGTRIEGLEPFVRCGQVCIREDMVNGVVKEAEDVVIVRGMVQGRSPNRLDALAYQSQFWGSARPRQTLKKDEEDIEEWNPLLEGREATRAYGLACAT